MESSYFTLFNRDLRFNKGGPEQAVVIELSDETVTNENVSVFFMFLVI